MVFLSPVNAITITYGAVTQTLQAWGFTYCTLHLRNRAPSTLILDTAGGDPALNASIPYGGRITVAFALGDGTTWYFQGTRRRFNAQAHAEAPMTSLQFEDVWSDLMLTIFQHYWSMLGADNLLHNTYFSRLNLFQDISAGPDSAWVYLTADNQLRQIIDFASEQCGIPVQYGEVDPVWNMPVFAVKAISCAEAIQLVLKPMPDMVTRLDYSTAPATIHFIARQNCASVTLPFAGTDANGRHHTSTDITPRPDLQAPAVVIQYQITGSWDGNNYDALSTDTFPSNATGLAENSLVIPIDLRGPNQSLVKATIKAVEINPASIEFWKIIKPDLNDPNIVFDPGTPIVDTTVNGGSGHPDGITILDGEGGAVSLEDYPNKLLPGGNPADWMSYGGEPVEGVPVTIRATLKYKKNNPLTSASLTHDVEKHVVETRVTLTNSPAGSQTYTTVGSSETGDPIPVHLAYFMWCSINNVPVNWVDGVATPPAVTPPLTDPENFQWEGEHRMVEDTIHSVVTTANVLNLAGGNSDWESMNAVIYAVDIDWFKGMTAIQFGPFKHLQAAEYFEMVMAFRYRQVWDNPALRNNGSQGAGGGTDLQNAQYKENTTHQIPDQSVLSTTSAPSGGDVVVLQHDANTNGGQMVAQTLDSAGAVVASQPQVVLSQSDLGGVDGTGRIARWRLFGVCNSAGEAQQAMFAASDPEVG